ncbi:DNA mismatch repair endonuclease MutL [Cellulosilyticum sp. I15G10I2]|uniref:DNA mismatch repair endonuclease MutL n=1 Tax=Cellulosilyticum sp. I15G10I2 TaxID=1892843 RepID=UPI00085CD40A|nr:DNA mismatch repair endonuclease MutL [Cellulosilyticum sp. I15G10I2]
MSVIKILDTHTINKIAAGEVVERPCSVVKELVENSIDAKASSITVEIKNGGIDFIRVTDNGVGIPKEEAEIAFLRHATSKISTADDLIKVLTLGFRGEALASIASVSHVELITKTAEDLTGKRIEVNGGKIISSEEIACPNGTTLIIRHIFYNVPARKEFLGSSSAEGAKISDHMTKLALAHPEISFKYIQNNKMQFTTSGNHDLINCVLNIYGKDTARNTFKFFYKAQAIECVGLLGNTSITRANRNYEHFFINGRYIKSTLLQRAVEAAYKTLVMVGKFPFIILHLHLDPAGLDVNVHPTKMQVRFRDEELIYNTVYQGITSSLKEENLVPQAVPKQSVSPAITSSSNKIQPEQIIVDTFFAPRKTYNEPSASTMLSRPVLAEAFEENKKEFLYKEEKLFGKMQEPIYNTQHTPAKDQSMIDAHFVSEHIDHHDIPYYAIIGQLFQTYWIIQYDEKIFIMDQHAAHERVMYEKFMLSFKRGEVPTQLLLLPESFSLTGIEQVIVNEHAILLAQLGFKFEAFGEDSIIIREVPFVFNQPLPPHVFKDVLDTLSINKLQDITSLKEDTIIKLACKSAIKANDKITEKECKYLIEELLRLDNPFTCPHGRPTLVVLSKSDIEKMFKRI